jgi:hypothetical protein
MMDYFNNIFLKTIDIWGFITIYLSFLEELYSKFKDLNEYEMQFINKIKYLIIHFLYESPTNLVNIQELVSELRSLNMIISKFSINVVSKKKNYLRDLEVQTNVTRKLRKRTSQGNPNRHKTSKVK